MRFTEIDECATQQPRCMNGGTCVDLVDNWRCICADDRWRGRRCEIGKHEVPIDCPVSCTIFFISAVFSPYLTMDLFDRRGRVRETTEGKTDYDGGRTAMRS